MGFSLVTGPTVEPVTVAEVKTHCRVDISDDDIYIGTLISAARQFVENAQNRAYVTQTWKYTCNQWPYEFLLMPSPVIAVSSITYIDTNGASQTLSASVYQTDYTGPVGRVRLAYNQTWPDLRGGDYAGITVTFTAGYGATAATTPDSAKHAIKMLAGHWYENREPVNIGNITTDLPMAVEALINMNRVMVAA